MTSGGALEEIYNFRWCTSDLASAGQPLAEEFFAIAQAGFEVVINLALLDAEYSVPDEPGLVRSLGMEFIHIPVVWKQPTQQDFHYFCAAMRQSQGRKMFLHCAANKRVSVFLALYRILKLDWPQATAMTVVEEVWHPNSLWQSFIDTVLSPLSESK